MKREKLRNQILRQTKEAQKSLVEFSQMVPLEMLDLVADD
jgi:hypothetical protein